MCRETVLAANAQCSLSLHLVSRIVDRSFKLKAAEKTMFVKMMREYEEFSGIEVRSFCMMSNHINITDGILTESTLDMWLMTSEDGDEYLVLDLGDTYDIDRIDLYNTHNRGANNYSTDDFRIEASNSVVDTGRVDDDDLSGTIATILSGNLLLTTGQDPIDPGESFTSITAHPQVAVRYLKFVSVSGHTLVSDPPGGPETAYNLNRRGLNEITIFGTQAEPIPEPSTLVLGLLGVLGFTRCRK